MSLENEEIYGDEEFVCYIEQEDFNSYEEGLKAFNSQRRILKRLTKKHSGKGFAIGLIIGNGYMVRIKTFNILKDGTEETSTIERKLYSDLNAETNIHMYVYGDSSDIIAREFEDIMNRQYERYYPHERFKYIYSQVEEIREYLISWHLDVIWPHIKAIYTMWKKYRAESKETLRTMYDKHEFIQSKDTALRLIKNEGGK